MGSRTPNTGQKKSDVGFLSTTIKVQGVVSEVGLHRIVEEVEF